MPVQLEDRHHSRYKWLYLRLYAYVAGAFLKAVLLKLGNIKQDDVDEFVKSFVDIRASLCKSCDVCIQVPHVLQVFFRREKGRMRESLAICAVVIQCVGNTDRLILD